MTLRRTTYALIAFVIFLFVFSISWRIYLQNSNETNRFSADIAKYSHLGGEFTLDSVAGKVTLSELVSRGTVVLYFGFTRCPDICPASLANLAGALKLLGAEEQQHIIPVMISADPEYDTIERLDQYVRFFIPQMIGLHGSVAQTQAIAKSYGAYFSKVLLPESSLGYTIDHTTRFYVLTKDGITTLFDYNLPYTEIADILRYFSR